LLLERVVLPMVVAVIQVLILPPQLGAVKVLGILLVALAVPAVVLVHHQAMKLVGLVILHQRLHRREVMAVMLLMGAVMAVAVAAAAHLL
jgi:hypothetical protein